MNEYEIFRRIFDNLMAKNNKKSFTYEVIARRIAMNIVDLNKRELHAVYMALKAIKK